MILALALAALALAGCGGGSSDSQNSTAATATAASAEDTANPAAAAEKGASGSPSGAKAKAKESNGNGDGDGTTTSGQGQKHGQRIAQPKGAPEPPPTPAEIANATVADITLESPAIVSSQGNPGSLSPTYTCDGKDSWPALSWSGVPPDTAELALYLMNVQPVEGKLFIDWALAGIDPSLSGLEAGQLPKGAVVGQNSFGKPGYSICPPGRGEIYMFTLYALPHRLGLRPGFDARQAREEILGISANAGLLPALYAHS